MVEDEDEKEEKLEFDSAGQAIAYISLDYGRHRLACGNWPEHTKDKETTK